MRNWLTIYLVLLCYCPCLSQQAGDSIPKVYPHASALLLYQAKFSHTQDIYKVSDTAAFMRSHPGYMLIGITRDVCKAVSYVYVDTVKPITLSAVKQTIQPTLLKRTPLLRVHGNIFYDVYYQSRIDTPYYEQNIYQHTIRTYLDVTVKDKYPLRLNFSTRFSNSGMFRDFSGVGLQYNVAQFKNNIRLRLQDYVQSQLERSTRELDSLKQLLHQTSKSLALASGAINNSLILQKITELKEKAYAQRFQVKDSILPEILGIKDLDITNTTSDKSIRSNTTKAFLQLLQDKYTENSKKKVIARNNNTDSALYDLQQRAEEDRKQYDSLARRAATLKQQYDSVSNKLLVSRENVLAGIGKAKNIMELRQHLQHIDIPDSLLPSGYKTLLAVRTIGIGRTIVDYSELSAQNITIKGFQGEYNPSWYFAVATGSIDYQFRDYVISAPTFGKQYLNIVRAGKGMRDGNNVIFTFFQGRKQLYNYYGSSNGTATNAPDFNLAGFTIETRHQFNADTYIILEAGKSSLPYFRRDIPKKGLWQSALQFSDHSNEAYAARFNTILPYTKTKIAAMYRYTGADYQSFSYYTTSSTQKAWSVKAEQYLFKRSLNIIASMRKNDFSNPYLASAFQSNTIFKSIQATLRLNKWPVVTVGYYPSTQLIKINNEQYMENLYYIFTGTVSHHYEAMHTRMNTMLSFVQFYNQPSDSGFSYFKSRNLLAYHFIYLGHTSLQFSLSEIKGTDYTLYTGGTGLQFQANKWFSMGGGVKYSNQTSINQQQLGYHLNTTIKIGLLGTVGFRAEKSFIPGINRQLKENKIGRLTFTKVF